MTPRSTPRHPLTSLAAAVLLIAISYAGPQPVGPIAALLVALVLAAWSGVGHRVVRLTIAAVIPTWVFLLMLAAAGDSSFASILLPGIVRDTALVALRLGAAVASLAWVISSVPPRRMMQAFAGRAVPPWAAYVVVASLAAVPEARRRAREVMEAQQCRGLALRAGLRGRLRALVALAGPLVISLVTESERHALALEARAFDPRARRGALDPILESPRERVGRAMLWLAALGTLGWGVVRRWDIFG